MRSRNKIIIISITIILLVSIICVVLIIFNNNPNSNQDSKDTYHVNDKYIEMSNKVSIPILNDFVAIETASYPSKSTQSTIYCGNTMKFVEDYTQRRNIHFVKNGNSYTLHVAQTQNSNITEPTTIFVNLEKYQGQNLGDGIIVDEENKIVKGDNNYNLCCKSNLGIATILSLAQSNEFKHGPLDIVIGNEIPKSTNKIIELGASDKLLSVVCNNSGKYESIDSFCQDAIGQHATKLENSSMPDNYIGIGFDIDDCATVHELLHPDCLGPYGVLLQRLLEN